MSSKPHDTFFKLAFGDPSAAEVLLRRNLCAEACNNLRWNTLTQERITLVGRHLEHRVADLAFSIQSADPVYADDRILFLMDHQSTNEDGMLYRMLDCSVLAAQQFKREHPERRHPRVYSVVIATVIGGWTSPTDMDDLLGPKIPGVERGAPEFNLLLDDVSHATNAELQALALKPVPKLALWLLRDSRDTETLLRNLRQWRREIDELFAAPNPREGYTSILSYLDSVLPEPDLKEFIRRLNRQNPQSKDTTMHYGERIRQEGLETGLKKGIQQGLEQGLEQGREQGLEQGLEWGLERGMRDTLERLLRHKFDAIPQPTLARVYDADRDQLGRYLDRILTATTIDEVFADPST